MTNRCRLLIVLSILGLVLGTLRDQSSLTALSLGVLIWLFFVWIHFSVRVEICWPKISIVRSINGRRDTRATLWSDREITVAVKLSVLDGKMPSYVVVRDLLPQDLVVDSGQFTTTLIDDEATVELEYSGHIASAGRVEFFGIHLCFQDPQGLFVSERVVCDGSVFRVLPSFTQVKDARSHIKRINSIPQHGIHTLRSAGIGGELLELREYQPGDPPKSIAWKVSARRGELMTRQYESEVPVRVTVFIDAGTSHLDSDAQARALNQFSSTAATVSKMAISVGDSVGLVLLGGDTARRTRPATGDRAFYRILESLADFCTPDGPSVKRLSDQTLRHVLLLFQERYPQLFEPRLLTRAFSILPLRPSKRRKLSLRRQLAAVIAELHDLSATQQIQLTFDDTLLAEAVQRWARESRVRLLVNSNTSQRQDPSKPVSRFEPLSHELMRAIAYAKDNELFVVISDLLNEREQLEPLVRAAQIAVARHHRVVFVCRLPAGCLLKESTVDTEVQTVDDVYRQARQVELLENVEALKRQLRSTGGRIAFVDDRNLVSILMAEAELAGSGRYSAGASAL